MTTRRVWGDSGTSGGVVRVWGFQPRVPGNGHGGLAGISGCRAWERAGPRPAGHAPSPGGSPDPAGRGAGAPRPCRPGTRRGRTAPPPPTRAARAPPRPAWVFVSLQRPTPPETYSTGAPRPHAAPPRAEGGTMPCAPPTRPPERGAQRPSRASARCGGGGGLVAGRAGVTPSSATAKPAAGCALSPSRLPP